MKKMLMLMLISLLGCLVILTACGDDNRESDAPIESGEEEQNEKGEQEDRTEEDGEAVDETELSPTPDEVVETHQVVLYFSDHDLMETYRMEKKVNVREGDQLEKAALEAWIAGPAHEELTGLVDSEVTIEYVEEVDGIAHVSFSKEIQESTLGSTGELMFAEQLAMIMEQFGFDQTQILVEGRVVETLLGHLSTGDPIEANDPEGYLWVDERKSREIVLQNSAFRIYEPVPDTEVKDQIVVRGIARVYEGTILYEFEDGHFILDEGFTTASEGAPGWGEFEIIIELDDVADYSGRVILFEESAKDGSRINELKIPVHVK